MMDAPQQAKDVANALVNFTMMRERCAISYKSLVFVVEDNDDGATVMAYGGSTYAKFITFDAMKEKLILDVYVELVNFLSIIFDDLVNILKGRFGSGVECPELNTVEFKVPVLDRIQYNYTTLMDAVSWKLESFYYYNASVIAFNYMNGISSMFELHNKYEFVPYVIAVKLHMDRPKLYVFPSYDNHLSCVFAEQVIDSFSQAGMLLHKPHFIIPINISALLIQALKCTCGGNVINIAFDTQAHYDVATQMEALI